ncbi:rCG51397, partial [Rattus norvegicus]
MKSTSSSLSGCPGPRRSGTALTSENFPRELTSKGQGMGYRSPQTVSSLPRLLAEVFCPQCLGITATLWSPLLASSGRTLRYKQMMLGPGTLSSLPVSHTCVPVT